MPIPRELYEKMEAERIARDAKRTREAEARNDREREYLSGCKLHLADASAMTEKDFRYMDMLEKVFADAMEYIKPELWRLADPHVDLEDIILSKDLFGRDCLTAPPSRWFKCCSREEKYGFDVPELVSCTMPSTVFAGYFTTAAELNPREMSDLQKVVIDPGNEQLDRVLSNLDGEQEFVTMPYGDEDGQPDGELVIFRDGHVFDSVPYTWFTRFREAHFAPDSVDADRLAVSIALDINHARRI